MATKTKQEPAKFSGLLYDVERVANDRLSALALYEMRTFYVEDGVIVKEERSRGMVEPELYARYMHACEAKIADAASRWREKRMAEEKAKQGAK